MIKYTPRENPKFKGEKVMKINKSLKKNDGVTLIALVITVIILIILVGVSLKFAAGGDGVLHDSKNAVDLSNVETAKEQVELSVAAYQTQYYKEMYIEKTLSVNVKMGDWIAQEYGGEDRLNKTRDYKFEITGTAPYVVTIKENNKLKEDVVGRLSSDGLLNWGKIPFGMEIGDIVEYSPSGSYEWKAEYATSYETTDEKYLNTELKSGYDQFGKPYEFNISKWKVFSMNESTGDVELVPVSSTELERNVKLQGAQGYNNAVKLLNDACKYLYSDVDKHITARNISIEDIEAKMTKQALEQAHSYQNIGAKYGKQIGKAYTAEYSKYPLIYGKEALSVITPENSSQEIIVSDKKGLKMSEQIRFVEREVDSGNVIGAVTTATSIKPYQTHWDKNNNEMQGAFEGEGTGSKNANYSVCLPNGNKTYYWIASRCINTVPEYCFFNVRNVIDGHVCSYYGTDYYEFSVEFSRPLFPVVTVEGTLFDEAVESDWEIE